MGAEKLFVVEGKNVNLMFRIPGNEMASFPTLDFTVAGSETEAIDKVFSTQMRTLKEYGERVEKLKEEGRLEKEMRNPLGGLGLFPPSKPVNKEEWRATPVTIPGYKIILEPIKEETA
ncbi:MAG: hypothetical protein LiPW39_115 [Parcubacteria group bacterium LiPW_39]|nr:MAG: hypothetical protein LiPW39_115 [Parcubacteria group bacterium LiPW_39]